MRRLGYAIATAVAFILIEIVRSIVFEPLNWYIGQRMSEDSDAYVNLLLTAMYSIVTAILSVPQGFFIGTSVGLLVASAIFYRIYTTDQIKRKRIDAIRRWRQMTVDAQANIDKLDARPHDPIAGLQQLERHPDYEEFLHVFNEEMEAYNTQYIVLLKNWYRRKRGLRLAHPVTSYSGVGLNYFVALMRNQITWLQKRWKIKADDIL